MIAQLELLEIAPPLAGLRVDLKTACPACGEEQFTIIHAGAGPHVAQLRCCGCGAHRMWLARQAADFITETVRLFGAPAEPIQFHERTVRIGETEMTVTKQFDNTNRGALFRCEQKESETDRDFAGSLNVGGVDHWISGRLRVSGKGVKYLALSVKPKQAAGTDKSKPASDELNDQIGF